MRAYTHHSLAHSVMSTTWTGPRFRPENERAKCTKWQEKRYAFRTIKNWNSFFTLGNIYRQYRNKFKITNQITKTTTTTIHHKRNERRKKNLIQQLCWMWYVMWNTCRGWWHDQKIRKHTRPSHTQKYSFLLRVVTELLDSFVSSFRCCFGGGGGGWLFYQTERPASSSIHSYKINQTLWYTCVYARSVVCLSLTALYAIYEMNSRSSSERSKTMRICCCLFFPAKEKRITLNWKTINRHIKKWMRTVKQKWSGEKRMDGATTNCYKNWNIIHFLVCLRLAENHNIAFTIIAHLIYLLLLFSVFFLLCRH